MLSARKTIRTAGGGARQRVRYVLTNGSQPFPSRPRVTSDEHPQAARLSRRLALGVAVGRSARSQTKVRQTEVRLFAGARSWHEVMPWQEATRRRPSKPTCQSWSWQTLPWDCDTRRSSPSSHRQPSTSLTGARQGCFPAIDRLLNSIHSRRWNLGDGAGPEADPRSGPRGAWRCDLEVI